jgi:hypothetical protein
MRSCFYSEKGGIAHARQCRKFCFVSATYAMFYDRNPDYTFKTAFLTDGDALGNTQTAPEERKLFSFRRFGQCEPDPRFDGIG